MKSDNSHIRLYGLKNKKINLTKTEANQGSMKFNEFWTALCKKTSGGFEFPTLARGYPFTATYSSGKIIVKPGTTKYERPLSNNEFYKVWIKAAKLSKQEIFIQSNYHDDTFHSSYILSMMKTILKGEEIEG